MFLTAGPSDDNDGSNIVVAASAMATNKDDTVHGDSSG